MSNKITNSIGIHTIPTPNRSMPKTPIQVIIIVSNKPQPVVIGIYKTHNIAHIIGINTAAVLFICCIFLAKSGHIAQLKKNNRTGSHFRGAHLSCNIMFR